MSIAPARREQGDQRDADRERRADGHRAGDAQPRAGAAADRERHQQAERGAGEHARADQRLQVAGDRVARLGADVADVELRARRHAGDGRAVDRAQVHAQARGQADRLEAGAPVDQRDVDVERAAVAGGDRQADLPDRQLLALREGDERAVAAEQRGRDDDQDRERAPG